jgi:hypothetical protein
LDFTAEKYSDLNPADLAEVLSVSSNDQQAPKQYILSLARARGTTEQLVVAQCTLLCV